MPRTKMIIKSPSVSIFKLSVIQRNIKNHRLTHTNTSSIGLEHCCQGKEKKKGRIKIKRFLGGGIGS